jgi:transcriptional regulator with XRE-family HTH domain
MSERRGPGRPRKPVDPVIRTPQQLIAWRESRNMTQVALAGKLGVHYMTVYRWEAGLVSIPLVVEYALRYLGAPVPEPVAA